MSVDPTGFVVKVSREKNAAVNVSCVVEIFAGLLMANLWMDCCLPCRWATPTKILSSCILPEFRPLSEGVRGFVSKMCTTIKLCDMTMDWIAEGNAKHLRKVKN